MAGGKGGGGERSEDQGGSFNCDAAAAVQSTDAARQL